MVPMQARVLSPVHGYSVGRPSGWSLDCSSVGESPSHHSSKVGLSDQRQSMVLELYCRKAGGKREGRKREREAGHEERWEKGEREEMLESKKA